MKEYPEKIFLVGGMRLADESLLTQWETFDDEFSLWVEQKDFQAHDSNIHVYGLSTLRNTYLEAPTGDEARRTRLFFILLGIGSFSGGLYFLYRFKRRLDRKQLRPDQVAIDPLMVMIAESPRKLVTGFFLFLLMIGLVVLPFKPLMIYLGVITSSYGGFLIWYQKQFTKVSWLASIRERHRERLADLSRRLATVPPKHLRAVQILLSKGAQVNIQDENGRTPLLIAANAGELEAVALLLRKGALPDIADAQGNTPLMVAAAQGHLGIVMKLLAAGAKVGLQNAEGASAILLAEGNKRNKAVVDVLHTALIREKLREKQAEEKAKERK